MTDPDAIHPAPHWPSRADAEEVVALLPIIEAHAWRAVIRRTQGVRADGSFFDSPYGVTAPEVGQLVDLFGAPNWTDSAYQPTAALAQLRDPAVVAQASLAQVRTLATVFVRGEHFCEGFWAGEFENGNIQRVLRRLQTLLTQADVGWREPDAKN